MEAAAPNPLESVQSCWIEDPAKGFIPSFRFFGLVSEGEPRPFRRFLKGERESVARYFMCLICETLFGEAPLLIDETPEGIRMVENPAWRNEPYLTQDDKGNWIMSDGSSLYDVTFMVTETVDLNTETANTAPGGLHLLPDPETPQE